MLIVLLLWSALPHQVRSQTNAGSPVDHMEELEKVDTELQKNYLEYISIQAHSNSVRKMEKRREELIRSVENSIREITRLRPYKGDASLRDTYADYLKILLTVFKEDYHKIVDMEEIAEQSYDNMEAFLLAQERAQDKLSEAAEKIEPAYRDFAARHNVTLTDDRKESKISKKLRKGGQVNQYYHTLFLVFFKSRHQEEYLLSAVEASDVNAIEQNRNTLNKYSEEGLLALDTIRPFNGDGTLINTCRKVLTFYQREASAAILTDFFLRKDEFEKVKKALDMKPEKQRTQADIDKYNKAVNAMNESVGEFNKTLEELNKSRAKVLNNWNEAVKRFMDTHIPNA